MTLIKFQIIISGPCANTMVISSTDSCYKKIKTKNFHAKERGPRKILITWSVKILIAIFKKIN